jgi:malonate-semialdehyde dehydrogenase (acetylating)/methylmalonate-semialdehyde dehydrogenase
MALGMHTVTQCSFSFGGWNESKLGSSDITGKSSIEFWTQNKKQPLNGMPKHR